MTFNLLITLHQLKIMILGLPLTFFSWRSFIFYDEVSLGGVNCSVAGKKRRPSCWEEMSRITS